MGLMIRQGNASNSFVKNKKLSLMYTQDADSDIQRENEKLYLENVQLKKSLEKEEFLHKALYKQWNELNIRRLTEKRELKQSESRNLFYKYAFYSMLFLIAPAYYFLTGSKSVRTDVASQTISPPTQTASRDTVQALHIRFEEKTNPPATIQPNQATINNQIVEKPLTDSIRSSIYWEGWSAYYEKASNPYQKSAQKSEVWLEGWKEGEKDARKK